MAQTINVATNTFSDGLIMDFSPGVAKNSSLSYALNATLLTFDGNELSLLNDKGNGRVETAYLPEGYIPVGTCEFGDIIYIVSYNPLENRSQIGCFPSPERNISSKEISKLELEIKGSELVEIGKDNKPTGRINSYSLKKIIYGNKTMNPGDKFLISWGKEGDNNKGTISDFGNEDHTYGYWPKLLKVHVVSIEDSGKINYLDSTIKWYDNDYIISNKAINNAENTDLDNYRAAVNSAYSVFLSKVSGKLALLMELERIDSFDCTYRKFKVGDVYKVFLSTSWQSQDPNINPYGFILTDVSSQGMKNVDNGKLLGDSDISNDYSFDRVIPYNRLYELEKPNFDSSFTYTEFLNNRFQSKINDYTHFGPIFLKDGVDEEVLKLIKYSEQGIPIPGTYVPNAYKFNNNAYYNHDNNRVYPALVPDDVVVLQFKLPVIKEIGELQKAAGDRHTLTYTVAPCMPYGVLDNLAITDTIDFDIDYKLEVDTWQYYVNNDSITLTWGLDAYFPDNEGIEKVIIEFYDNQGIAATYEVTDKDSYSGQFTEYILLDQQSTNYRMHSYKYENGSTVPIYHALGGTETLAKDINPEEVSKYCKLNLSTLTASELRIEDLTQTDQSQYKIYLNDAGILHRGFVYLCKIRICKGTRNSLDQIISDSEAVDYRWLWTTDVFNDLYGKKEYKDLPLNLDFDFGCSISGKRIKENKYLYYNKNLDFDSKIEDSENYKNLSAEVMSITSEEDGNILFKAGLRLTDEHNCFSINPGLNGENLKNITCTIETNNPRIELPLEFESIYELEERADREFINPIKGDLENTSHVAYGKAFLRLINNYTPSSIYDLYDKPESYKSYTDWFQLEISDLDLYSTLNEQRINSGDTTTYLDALGNSKTSSNTYYTTNVWDIYNTGVYMSLDGMQFSKMYAYSTKLDTEKKMLSSLISDIDKAEQFNLGFWGGKPLTLKMLGVGMSENKGQKARASFGVFDLSGEKISYNKTITYYRENEEWRPSVDDEKLQEGFKGSGVLAPFIPIMYYNYPEEGSNAEELYLSENCENNYTKLFKYLSGNGTPREDIHGKNITKGRATWPTVNSDKVLSWGTSGVECTSIPCGLAVKSGNDIIPIATMGVVSTYNTDKKTSYGEGCRILLTLSWKEAYSNNPESYAQMLASLYSQLYAVNGYYEGYSYSNLVTLKPYSEYWKKDIIVSIKLPLTNEIVLKYNNYAKCLAINNIPYLKYINQIIKKVLGTDNISEAANVIDISNVSPHFEDITKCFEFNYEVKYDVDLLYQLMKESSDAKARVNVDDVRIVNTYNIKEDRLYVYEDGLFVELHPKHLFKCVNTFNVDTQGIWYYSNWAKKDLNVNLTRNFVETLKYNNGMLYIDDISKLPNYNKKFSLYWNGTGDNPGIVDIPNVNIFNYTSF